MLDIYDALHLDSEWQTRGLCHDEAIDPEMFHPVGRSDNPLYDQDVEAAKAICAKCPVRLECLVWAMESRQQEGVWGGMEEEERTELMRRALRAGSLALAPRYLTNNEISDDIAKKIRNEQRRLRHLDELDEDARRRALQQQG